MLEVQNLSKKYGKNLAVDQVNFVVPDGTIGSSILEQLV